MRLFILRTHYHDYEAHDTTPYRSRAYIRVCANNYLHAVIKANKYIKHQNSEFNAYDFIPLPRRS